MLVIRNSQATAHQDVLYWDNGREKIRVPKGEEKAYYIKELSRAKAEHVYKSAKDQQLIGAQKQTIEGQALELDIAKAALIISDNSLENARKRIMELSQ